MKEENKRIVLFVYLLCIIWVFLLGPFWFKFGDFFGKWSTSLLFIGLPLYLIPLVFGLMGSKSWLKRMSVVVFIFLVLGLVFSLLHMENCGGCGETGYSSFWGALYHSCGLVVPDLIAGVSILWYVLSVRPSGSCWIAPLGSFFVGSGLIHAYGFVWEGYYIYPWLWGGKLFVGVPFAVLTGVYCYWNSRKGGG